jgi:hypothetical protein
MNVLYVIYYINTNHSLNYAKTWQGLSYSLYIIRYVLCFVGSPGLVEPTLDKQDISGLRSCIEAQKTMLSYDQYLWWQTFLQNPLEILSSLSVPHAWPLSRLQRYFTASHPTPVMLNLQSPLAAMQMKELQRPTVFSTNPQSGRIGQCKEGLAVGFMIAYKALGNQRRANVGQIEAIRDEHVKITKYVQCHDSKWKRDKDENRYPLIKIERVLCVFRLTTLQRLPAFAVKKIREYTKL